MEGAGKRVSREAPGQPRLRLLATALLWLVVCVVLALLVVGHIAPDRAVRLAAVVSALTGFAARIVLLAAIVWLIAWPPAWPWIRVTHRRLRDQLATDSNAYRTAVARLEHLETAPDLITAGRFLASVGRNRDAVPMLERASALEPDNLVTRLALGRALLASGAADRAIPHLQHLVRVDPGHAYGEALQLLGNAQFRSGDLDAAARTLTEHEQRNGAMRAVDLLRARIARQAGDLALAKELAARAAKKPDNRQLLPAEALDRARARVLSWQVGRPATASKADESQTNHTTGESSE